jgi:hypothetical protein
MNSDNIFKLFVVPSIGIIVVLLFALVYYVMEIDIDLKASNEQIKQAFTVPAEYCNIPDPVLRHP